MAKTVPSSWMGVGLQDKRADQGIAIRATKIDFILQISRDEDALLEACLADMK
jgi:hypothetical protein